MCLLCPEQDNRSASKRARLKIEMIEYSHSWRDINIIVVVYPVKRTNSQRILYEITNVLEFYLSLFVAQMCHRRLIF